MKKQKMKVFRTLIAVISIVLLICGHAVYAQEQENSNHLFRGKVLKIYNDQETQDKSASKKAEVKILDGDYKGKVYVAELQGEGITSSGAIVKEGGYVLLKLETSDGKIKSLYIQEVERNREIIVLIIIFVILLFLVGGLKGLKSIITLAITGGMIAKVMLPMMLKGVSPIPLTILVSIVVIVVNLTIISGFNKKTLAAILGTTGGVIISGIIAIYCITSFQLKGFPMEEAQIMTYIFNPQVPDFRGILFTGILMGALGAVMDISMSIASSMNELKTATENISKSKLFFAGMNVGRDIMGSMSNTLILAYAGSSMYLMFLVHYYGYSLYQTLNLDLVASEMVNALAGSIGIVLAIPLTAAMVIVLGYKDSKSSKS